MSILVMTDRPTPAVPRVTINKPERRNALGPELRDALIRAVAAAPAEALAISRGENETFALLLADVAMPSMSASKLWEAIRRGRDVRVLYRRGFTDDTIVRHGVLEGEIPFLITPFTKQSPLDRAREAIGKVAGAARRVAGPAACSATRARSAWIAVGRMVPGGEALPWAIAC